MLMLLAEKFVTDTETLLKIKELMTVGAIIEMIREDAIKDDRIKMAKKLLN